MNINELKQYLKKQIQLDDKQVGAIVKEHYLMDADKYFRDIAGSLRDIVDSPYVYEGDDFFELEDVTDDLFTYIGNDCVYHDKDEYGWDSEEWNYSGDSVKDAVYQTGKLDDFMNLLNHSYAIQVAVEPDGNIFPVPIMRNRETGAYRSILSLEREVEDLLPDEVEVTTYGPQLSSGDYYDPPEYPESQDYVHVPYDVRRALIEGYRGASERIGEYAEFIELETTAQKRAEIAGIKTVTIDLATSSDYLQRRLQEECWDRTNASSWTNHSKHSVKTEDLELVETLLAEANAEYTVDLGICKEFNKVKTSPGIEDRG